MEQNKTHLEIITSIFDFLYDRHPLVLASMINNSAYPELMKYHYENWQHAHSKRIKQKREEIE